MCKHLVAMAVVAAILMAAAPSATAQPVQAGWAGLGPGYWDDPAMWLGLMPGEIPDDELGGLYDCQLIVPGDLAVVRSPHRTGGAEPWASSTFCSSRN